MSNGLNYSIGMAAEIAKLPVVVQWLDRENLWKISWRWQYSCKWNTVDVEKDLHVMFFDNMTGAKEFYLSLRTKMLEVNGS